MKQALRMLLVAVSLIAVTAAAAQDKSWVGEAVLPVKRANEISLKDRVREKEVVYPYSGQWPLKVREERGGQIRLNDGYREGWATNSDFVPVKDAPAYFDRRIRTVPTDAWAWNMRGAGWGEKREYDKAIADYNEAIRLDPKDSIIVNNRGLAWFYKKDYDRAIRDFDEAIRLKPKYALAYSNRAVAWLRKNEPDRAIRDADEALRLRHDFTWARVARGEAYAMKKEYDRALADFEDAIRLDPDYALAYFEKAEAHAQKGDTAEALDSFKRSLELGFRNVERIKLDPALQPIRNLPEYGKLLEKYVK